MTRRAMTGPLSRVLTLVCVSVLLVVGQYAARHGYVWSHPNRTTHVCAHRVHVGISRRWHAGLRRTPRWTGGAPIDSAPPPVPQDPFRR